MDINKIPESITNDLKERGLSESEIELSSPEQLLEEYMSWHGIIGWSQTFISAYKSLKEANQ